MLVVSLIGLVVCSISFVDVSATVVVERLSIAVDLSMLAVVVGCLLCVVLGSIAVVSVVFVVLSTVELTIALVVVSSILIVVGLEDATEFVLVSIGSVVFSPAVPVDSATLVVFSYETSEVISPKVVVGCVLSVDVWVGAPVVVESNSVVRSVVTCSVVVLGI